MDIRLISTLTADDEARVAAAICATAGALLDHLAITYTIRVETGDGEIFQQHNTPVIDRVAGTAALMAAVTAAITT
jgi:phosphate/sulfate permease